MNTRLCYSCKEHLSIDKFTCARQKCDVCKTTPTCKYCGQKKQVSDFPKMGMKCLECIKPDKKIYNESIKEEKKQWAIENAESVR